MKKCGCLKHKVEQKVVKLKESIVDIRSLILELRPDLCRRFGFDLPENSDAYLGWLLSSGIKEYAALQDAAALRADFQATGFGPNRKLNKLQYVVWKARPDVQQAFPLLEKAAEYFVWFYTHGLEEHGFWPFLSPAEQAYVLQLPEPWAARVRAALSAMTKEPELRVSFNNCPFGVNLVGYAFGQLGIGEDARMTALENGRYYAERGSAQFADRYNIGYWPWELSLWPKQWESMVDLVDEVWVSTQHTLDALAPVCAKPIISDEIKSIPCEFPLVVIGHFPLKDLNTREREKLLSLLKGRKWA
jgi:hypothetical protein